MWDRIGVWLNFSLLVAVYADWKSPGECNSGGKNRTNVEIMKQRVLDIVIFKVEKDLINTSNYLIVIRLIIVM